MTDFYDADSLQGCIGGTLVREDMRKLEAGVHIVVGTPGRVFDMINRRALDVASVKQFVLDEADELLSRDSKDPIYDIVRLLPSTIQVIIFSTTMPLDVLEVTKRFMRDPIRILVKKGELSLDGIKQYYISVERKESKLDTTSDLYETLTITQAVIFVNTRRTVNWLTEKMHAREFAVASMHGRRHVAAGARRHHARVPDRLGLRPHPHGWPGPCHKCAAGVARHPLRPSDQPRRLHPLHWSRRPIWP